MASAYLTNDTATQLPVFDAHEELLRCLSAVVAQAPPQTPWQESERHGLYSGPVSFAYLFMRVSESHPTLSVASKLPREWAAAYLADLQSIGDVSPNNCGILNEELSFCAVSAIHTQDLAFVRRMIQHIEQASFDRTGSNEWAVGRAGTLYLLRLVRTSIPESEPLVSPVIKRLVDFTLEVGPDWIFRDTRILGAGHGDVGILTQILLSDSSYAAELRPKLLELLDWQNAEGNWPHNAGADSKVLVQFCHGAPGFVFSLLAIRHVFPDLEERIDVAIEKARALTWEKGLLRKIPNLCHGIAGNALAFPPGHQRDRFLAHCTQEYIEKGIGEGLWETADYGVPCSLGFGTAGLAWAWMMRDDAKGTYITFNDI